jgi:hypothetical protein
MRELLRQIEAALEANLYYLALFVSLALPDICGAIDSSDGTASGAKYAAWFDKYVAPRYGFRGHQFLTGEDCYRFRCSLLHQGRTQHPRSTYSRVLFVEPRSNELTIQINIINDALNIDMHIFCQDVMIGARQWLDEVENTQQFKTNYDQFMRLYPQGLPPYIVGVPVIS